MTRVTMVEASFAIYGEEDGARLVRVELPLKLESEANQREHWAKKAARVKRQRGLACAYLGGGLVGAGWGPTGSAPLRFPLEVTITRLAPTKLDSDNLSGSAKACRDGVAQALGADDGPRWPIKWAVEQQHAGVRRYGVRIEIREAPELPTC